MWGSKKNVAVAGATTLISSDTVVVGDLRFSGNLDVEGLVQGNIVAHPDKEALLRIIGEGRVEGEIHVPSVVINGEVKGSVYASKQLDLAPRSRVDGNVYYNLVEMAAGAEVNGSLMHMTDNGEHFNSSGYNPAQTGGKNDGDVAKVD